ncbi:MAG TPA: ribonuclease III [Rhodospirillaceae bacterium]|nr:ribonuclease III [Rhodospirillaceae bacterium]
MPSVEAMNELMAALDYHFDNDALMADALRHPSMTGARGQKRTKSASPYERLEFLGDRVLGLVIAHWLFEVYDDIDEGALAKRHAALVNRDALRVVALKLKLDHYLRHAHGEDANLAQKNTAALSDAMEALIGAIYLDGGLEPAQRLIKRLWQDQIEAATLQVDPKCALQEFAQGKGLPLPVYKVTDRSGPAHAPSFVIEVSVRGYAAMSAKGSSKREAEKAAAQALLEEIGKK